MSVLEEGLDMVSLYGLVPSLLLLRSLVELGRGSDALDLCLKVIAGWRGLGQPAVDVQTGVQMAQILLLASIAALSCDQYQLAYVFALRYVLPLPASCSPQSIIIIDVQDYLLVCVPNYSRVHYYASAQSVWYVFQEGVIQVGNLCSIFVAV